MTNSIARKSISRNKELFQQNEELKLFETKSMMITPTNRFKESKDHDSFIECNN